MESNLTINKLDDFIGNKDKIEEIKKLLVNSQQNKCILIKGPPISGKTTLIKLILEELNLNYIKLIATKLPSKKNMKFFLNQYFNTCNVSNLILNKLEKSILVIDNIETLNNNHKYILLELSKRYNKTKIIVFITNKSHFKCSKIINEMSTTITLDHPKSNEIVTHITKHFPDIDLEWLNSAIVQSNNNINIIYNSIYNKKIVSSVDGSNNLFIIVYKLLTDYISLETVINYYNNDKYLLPLIFHENYIQYLNKLNINKKNKYDILFNIMNSLIDYDQLDNYMYAYQYWDLQDICGLISCSVGSYYINKYRTDSVDESIINSMKFTSYLNKVSLISINRKTIEKLSNCFKINDIYKLLRIRHLIINNETSELEDILSHYKITNKEITSLQKIDKLSNAK